MKLCMSLSLICLCLTMLLPGDPAAQATPRLASCGSDRLSFTTSLSNARDLGSSGCLVVAQEHGATDTPLVVYLAPDLARPLEAPTGATLGEVSVTFDLTAQNYRGTPAAAVDRDGEITIAVDVNKIEGNGTSADIFLTNIRANGTWQWPDPENQGQMRRVEQTYVSFDVIKLVVLKRYQLFSSYSDQQRGITMAVAEVGWKDGRFVLTPLPNYDLSLSGSPLKLSPSEVTTDAQGMAWSAVIAPLSIFDPTDPSYLGSVTVKADTNVRPSTISPIISFARVISVQGPVYAHTALSPVGFAVSAGMTMQVGDWLELRAVEPDDLGRISYPSVAISLADWSTIEIVSLDNAAAQSRVILGTDGVSTVSRSFFADLSKTLWGVTNDPTPYLRIVVVNAVQFGIDRLVPGGFLVREGLSYVVDQIGGASSQRLASAEPAGPNGSWRYRIEIRANSDVVVQNDFVSTPLQVRGPGGSVMLGAGSFVVARGSELGAFSPILPVSRASGKIPLAVGLTPAPDATGMITTRTPLITMIWPDEYFNQIAQETMHIWVNGVLMRETATPGSGSSQFGAPERYQVPPSARLRHGPNTIQVALQSLDGVLSEATLVVTATGTPTTPTGLTALAGQHTVALRWSSNPEPDLQGYQLFRAAAADGPFSPYATLAATQTMFLDTTPLAAGWYALAALDPAGITSLPSAPVAAPLLGAGAAPLPAAPTGMALTPAKQAIRVSFLSAGDHTAAWKIQRAEQASGPYQDLAVVGHGLLEDQAITPGVSYWYRVIPLGADMAEGLAASAGPVSASADPPGAPMNLLATYAAYQVRLAWDHSPDPTVAGYRVYRSTHAGTFILRAQVAAGSSTYREQVDWNTWHTYRVTAVDQFGREGSPATSHTVSAFLADGHPQLYQYLPLVKSTG